MNNNTIIELVNSSLHHQGNLSLPYNLLLSLYKKNLGSFLIAWFYLQDDCGVDMKDEKSYNLIYCILTNSHYFTHCDADKLENFYNIAQSYWLGFSNIQKEKIIEHSMKMPYIWQHYLISLTHDASFFAAYSQNPIVYLKSVNHLLDIWINKQNVLMAPMEHNIINNAGTSFLSIIKYQYNGLQQYIDTLWNKSSISSSIYHINCTSSLESNTVCLKILNNILNNLLERFPFILSLLQAGNNYEKEQKTLLEINLFYKKCSILYPYSMHIIHHALPYNHLINILLSHDNYHTTVLYYEQFPDKLYGDYNKLCEKSAKIEIFLNNIIYNHILYLPNLQKNKYTNWKTYAQDIENKNMFSCYVYYNEVLLSLHYDTTFIFDKMCILLHQLDEYLSQKTLVDNNTDLKILSIYMNKYVLSYQLQQKLYIDDSKKEKGKKTTKI